MGAVQHRPERRSPWRAYYRAPDGRQISRAFARKVDAEKWLATQTADVARGEWIDPRLGTVTVGEWSDRFVASRVHLRPSTRARDQSVMANLVLPMFANHQLAAVATADVEAWVAELVAADYAADTVRKAHQLLAGIFGSAIRSGLIARTPCVGVRLPQAQRREMRFLGSTEIQQLADAIDPTYRILVLTGAYGGLRFGEATALRVRSLDPLRQSLSVTQTLSEVGGAVSFGQPKTSAARRTVALPRFLSDELAAYVVGGEPDDLVFEGPRGGPMRRTNFRRRFWLPAVRESVGEPCRFHDLRHSHVALLIRQGEHPKVIASRLGHTSVRTVLDVYGHLYEGLDEAAAGRLDETWTESRAAQVLPRPRSSVIEFPVN